MLLLLFSGAPVILRVFYLPIFSCPITEVSSSHSVPSVSIATTTISDSHSDDLPLPTTRGQRSPSLALSHEAVTDGSSILSLPSPLAPIAEPELPAVFSSLPPLPLSLTTSNESSTTGSFKPSTLSSLSPLSLPPPQTPSLDITGNHHHHHHHEGRGRTGRGRGGAASQPIRSTVTSSPYSRPQPGSTSVLASDSLSKNRSTANYIRSSSSSSSLSASPSSNLQPSLPVSQPQSSFMLPSSITVPSTSLPSLPVSLSGTPLLSIGRSQHHQPSDARRDIPTMYQTSRLPPPLPPASTTSSSSPTHYYTCSTSSSQLQPPLQRNMSPGTILSPTHQAVHPVVSNYGHSPSSSFLPDHATNPLVGGGSTGRLVPTCTPLPINLPSINQGFGFARTGGIAAQQGHAPPKAAPPPPMPGMLPGDMGRGGSYMSRSNSAGNTMVTPSLPSLPSFTALNVPFPSSTTAPAGGIIPTVSSSSTGGGGGGGGGGSGNLSLFSAGLYPYTQFVGIPTVPAQMNAPFAAAAQTGLQMPAQPNPAAAAMTGYPYIPGMSPSLYNTQVSSNSFTR